MNAVEEQRVRGAETRCYTLTGASQSLDAAERILQALERADEAQEWHLLFFAVKGQQSGVTLRTLATWEEEEG